MQTARILQAVLLMMIVAMAASCAVGKEYTSKLFAQRIPVQKDSQVLAGPALRFLETDSTGTDQEGWVSTDIIMGRDTATNTFALDKLAMTLPANTKMIHADTAIIKEPIKSLPLATGIQAKPAEASPVARAANPGEVRTKRTREK